MDKQGLNRKINNYETKIIQNMQEINRINRKIESLQAQMNKIYSMQRQTEDFFIRKKTKNENIYELVQGRAAKSIITKSLDICGKANRDYYTNQFENINYLINVNIQRLTEELQELQMENVHYKSAIYASKKEIATIEAKEGKHAGSNNQ